MREAIPPPLPHNPRTTRKMKGPQHGYQESTVQHHQPRLHRHQRGRQAGRKPLTGHRQRQIRGRRPSDHQRREEKRPNQPGPGDASRSPVRSCGNPRRIRRIKNLPLPTV